MPDMSDDFIWDWYLLERERSNERHLAQTEAELRDTTDALRGTTEDLRVALRRTQIGLERTKDELRALTAMVGAMGDLLAVSGALDGVKLRERFQERLQQLTHPQRPAGSPKVVHLRECVACGAKNRGDLPACAKCGGALA
jgi:hypothetical protein